MGFMDYLFLISIIAVVSLIVSLFQIKSITKKAWNKMYTHCRFFGGTYADDHVAGHLCTAKSMQKGIVCSFKDCPLINDKGELT